MNKSTYQIYYRLHSVQSGGKREASRPRSTKLFTLPIPPVLPTYTEAFSRKFLPENYNNILNNNCILERRNIYLKPPESIIRDAGNVNISEITSEIILKNGGLRAAACLLGAADLSTLAGIKSTYQADYKGLKPDSVEFENVDVALKKLAQAPDNYTLDSLQRASYNAKQQVTSLLKPNTTRYGCNKDKAIPASGALPSIKLFKKKFGLEYKRTSYQDSYKLPKLCKADNHIRGLELHPLGSKGMEISGNELLTRKSLNRKKTCQSTKFITEVPTTQGYMDITMDRTNMTKLPTVV